MVFIGKIAGSARNSSCYIHLDKNQYEEQLRGEVDDELLEEYLKDEFKEINADQVFEYKGMKIFSTNNTYSDHITGLSIGEFTSKEECIAYLDKIGQKEYFKTIRLSIKLTGISPAYKFEFNY